MAQTLHDAAESFGLGDTNQEEEWLTGITINNHQRV